MHTENLAQISRVFQMEEEKKKSDSKDSRYMFWNSLRMLKTGRFAGLSHSIVYEIKFTDHYSVQLLHELI